MESIRIQHSIGVLGALILAACALLLGPGAKAAGAAETPFKVEFDKSDIQMEALSMLGGLPLDSVGSNATMEGTLADDGSVNVPKGKFVMPEIGITEPVAIKGFMGIESAATGTFDQATGQLELDAKAGLWLSVNVAQLLDQAEALGLDLSGQLGEIGPYVGLLGNLTCGFSPMDVHFTTESTSLANGQRFTGGLTGTGAITTEWSQLGPFAGRTKILGLIDACSLLKSMLPGLLENLGGGTDVGGIDLGGLLGGIDLENLDNIDLGPSGITLTKSAADPIPGGPDPDPDPDPDPRATPAKLKLTVTPKKRRAKPGTRIRYRAKVKNVGGSRANRVKVCIRAPKGATKVKRCQKLGSLAPKKAKQRFFKLRLKPSVKRRSYRISFRTSSDARSKPTSSARILIRRGR